MPEFNKTEGAPNVAYMHVIAHVRSTTICIKSINVIKYMVNIG